MGKSAQAQGVLGDEEKKKDGDSGMNYGWERPEKKETQSRTGGTKGGKKKRYWVNF